MLKMSWEVGKTHFPHVKFLLITPWGGVPRVCCTEKAGITLAWSASPPHLLSPHLTFPIDSPPPPPRLTPPPPDSPLPPSRPPHVPFPHYVLLIMSSYLILITSSLSSLTSYPRNPHYVRSSIPRPPNDSDHAKCGGVSLSMSQLRW